VGPLVFCPNGHVFESRAFSFTNATNVTFSGSRENCPFCGAWAEIMDGEFNFVADTIEVLSAPQITIDRLRSLELLVRRMVAERKPAEEIIEAIENEAPAVAAQLRHQLPSNAPGWIAVFLALLTLLVGLRQLEAAEHPRPLPNIEIEQIVRTVIDSQQSHGHKPPPPSPPALRPNRQARRHPPRQRP
jgi:hypothetical protein